MKLRLILSFVLVLLSSQIAWAADPEIYSHKKRGAIKGADVVAYFSLDAKASPVLGKKEISHDYKGATWYFSTEENKQLFIASPEKYLPEYGGYCAYAVSQGYTADINPKYWHLINGKLYLNNGFIADKLWKNGRDEKIALADKNWPTVLTACEAKDKCSE